METNGIYETDVKKWDERHPVEKGVVVQGESIHSIVLLAIQNKYTPEFIEKMMDLVERNQKNIAWQAYVKAMAAFKANPPEILKTAHVSYINAKNQEVQWDHAVLGEITEAITKSMSPYGLYHRWDMEQPDAKTVKTTCIITHEMGHSERMSMQGPPDTSGNKDELKAVSSTNTLFQRLTLLAVTGLAAKGMDRDEPPEEAKFITEKQVSEIIDMMNDIGLKESSLTNLFGCKLIEHIPAARHQEAITALKDAKKRKEAKAKA